jgi:8-oxo-dGTP diphosphatase
MTVLTTLCYLRRDKHTLMLHRVKKDKDIHQGKWNGLGGKFLPGETPEECVKREIYEESGYTLHTAKLHGVLTFPNFKNNEDWIAYIYTSSDFSGTQTECDEGALEWIPDDTVPSLKLWEGDPIFLDWIYSNKPFFSGKFCYENKQLTFHSVTFY